MLGRDGGRFGNFPTDSHEIKDKDRVKFTQPCRRAVLSISKHIIKIFRSLDRIGVRASHLAPLTPKLRARALVTLAHLTPKECMDGSVQF